MRGPAEAIYRPVVDGRNLPAGPWAPEAPALSADIPMIVGTTATEMTLLTGARDPATFTLDDAGLRKRLAEWFAADDIDKVIATFRATRPKATPSDLFFAIATDKAMREGAWQQAERKARQATTPVWFYELDWATPVDGGKWGSPHSLDLAMVFDNVALSASMVGTGPDPQAVADQMSAAWLAFARTGNPNNPHIPDWPAYRLAHRATMCSTARRTWAPIFAATNGYCSRASSRRPIEDGSPPCADRADAASPKRRSRTRTLQRGLHGFSPRSRAQLEGFILSSTEPHHMTCVLVAMSRQPARSPKLLKQISRRSARSS